MKTRKLCIYLCTVLCINSLLAQEELGNGFLFPKFENGTVIFKKGNRVTALLNYNLQVQEMLFADKEQQVMALANLPDILAVVINERRFIPTQSGGIFYEEIKTENGFFYIQHKATMISQGKEAGYGGRSQTSATTSIGSLYNSDAVGVARLESSEKFAQKRDNFYYLKSGNSYKRFVSAKTLGKLFKSQASKIEGFAKDNSINFTKIDDIAKIVDYGFSLTK